MTNTGSPAAAPANFLTVRRDAPGLTADFCLPDRGLQTPHIARRSLEPRDRRRFDAGAMAVCLLPRTATRSGHDWIVVIHRGVGVRAPGTRAVGPPLRDGRCGGQAPARICHWRR